MQDKDVETCKNNVTRGFFWAKIRGILATFARHSLANCFPDFVWTTGQERMPGN